MKASGWLGDMWGGLAASLVALPSSIAFGVVAFSAVSSDLAGAGAFAGIIGAAVLGIVAPLIGRTGGLITAPCAPSAAVLSAVAIDLAGRALAPARILTLLALTAAFSAVAQMIYGALRAGRLIKFIPYQVVSGYLSGVALIIAAAQLPRLLGVPKHMHLLEALTVPAQWQWPGIIVGTATIGVMVLAPRVTTRVPGAILGLFAGIAVYFALGVLWPALWTLEGNPLVIGPVQAGGGMLAMAQTRLAGLRDLQGADVVLVLGPALTLSVLLSIDTLKTGVVLDAMTRTRSDSDRGLLGQGVANGLAFLVGGMPGAGTAGPTLVNLASGGKTLKSGVLEGVFVLLAFVALGDLVAWVPIGALAGILLVIAARMFDFKSFMLVRSPDTRLDFFIIAAVVVTAEGVGLIQASAVGVLLAIVLFIRDQIRGSVVWRKGDLGAIRSKRSRSAEENEILSERGTTAVVVQLRGNLFFGTTDQLFTELEEELKTARFLLLDLRRVGSIDYTAANLLKQMRARLKERDGELLLAGMPSSAPTGRSFEDYLMGLGLIEESNGIKVFETRDSALEWMEHALLASWGYSPPESRPLDLEEIGLLRGLDPHALDGVRRSAHSVSVKKGERVFASGDMGDELFFVRRGRVHILLPLEHGKRHHLGTFGQGEFFGEIAFLDRSARSADAEAAVDSELFSLSRADFDALAQRDPALAGRMFEQLARAIAKRLRITDGELQVLEER